MVDLGFCGKLLTDQENHHKRFLDRPFRPNLQSALQCLVDADSTEWYDVDFIDGQLTLLNPKTLQPTQWLDINGWSGATFQVVFEKIFRKLKHITLVVNQEWLDPFPEQIENDYRLRQLIGRNCLSLFPEHTFEIITKFKYFERRTTATVMTDDEMEELWDWGYQIAQTYYDAGADLSAQHDRCGVCRFRSCTHREEPIQYTIGTNVGITACH